MRFTVTDQNHFGHKIAPYDVEFCLLAPRYKCAHAAASAHLSQALRKQRHALSDHDAQPGSGNRDLEDCFAIAQERRVAPLAKIPVVGLLYKNSVVNATGKNAILEMVSKYSIHRSSEFISDIVFDRKRSRRDQCRDECSRAINLDELSSFATTRLELASSELSLGHGCPGRTPLGTKLTAVLCCWGSGNRQTPRLPAKSPGMHLGASRR